MCVLPLFEHRPKHQHSLPSSFIFMAIFRLIGIELYLLLYSSTWKVLASFTNGIHSRLKVNNDNRAYS